MFITALPFGWWAVTKLPSGRLHSNSNANRTWAIRNALTPSHTGKGYFSSNVSGHQEILGNNKPLTRVVIATGCYSPQSSSSEPSGQSTSWSHFHDDEIQVPSAHSYSSSLHVRSAATITYQCSKTPSFWDKFTLSEKKPKANVFLWSLSLINVNIKWNTFWTHPEAMSLSLSPQ